MICNNTIIGIFMNNGFGSIDKVDLSIFINALSTKEEGEKEQIVSGGRIITSNPYNISNTDTFYYQAIAFITDNALKLNQEKLEDLKKVLDNQITIIKSNTTGIINFFRGFFNSDIREKQKLQIRQAEYMGILKECIAHAKEAMENSSKDIEKQPFFKDEEGIRSEKSLVSSLEDKIVPSPRFQKSVESKSLSQDDLIAQTQDQTQHPRAVIIQPTPKSEPEPSSPISKPEPPPVLQPQSAVPLPPPAGMQKRQAMLLAGEPEKLPDLNESLLRAKFAEEMKEKIESGTLTQEKIKQEIDNMVADELSQRISNYTTALEAAIKPLEESLEKAEEIKKQVREETIALKGYQAKVETYQNNLNILTDPKNTVAYLKMKTKNEVIDIPFYNKKDFDIMRQNLFQKKMRECYSKTEGIERTEHCLSEARTNAQASMEKIETLQKELKTIESSENNRIPFHQYHKILPAKQETLRKLKVRQRELISKKTVVASRGAAVPAPSSKAEADKSVASEAYSQLSPEARQSLSALNTAFDNKDVSIISKNPDVLFTMLSSYTE